MAVAAEKLKYLEILQATIKRMADNSFLLKGWCATVVSMIIALVNLKGAVYKAEYIALLPAVVFWGLDAYFLWQERLFRRLYELEIEDLDGPPTFTLDTSAVRGKVKGWMHALVAKTIWPFYLAILLPSAFAITYLQPGK